ncbi:hypothetical protein WSM22_46950 [Cytophagales bacterium WSM2-2]|nr:hypothetical protein WSM22_46950 [Cytophagales bacterium WSM2-2]
MKKTTNIELWLLINLVSLLILYNQPAVAQSAKASDSLVKQSTPKLEYDSTKVPGRATKKLGNKFMYIGGALFLGGTIALNLGADEDIAGRFAGPGFLLLAAGIPMTIFGSAAERRFLHKKYVPGRDLKIIGPLLTAAGVTWIWWVGTIAFDPQVGEALLVVPELALLGAALTCGGIVLWKKGIKQVNNFKREHSLSMEIRPTMNGAAIRIKF